MLAMVADPGDQDRLNLAAEKQRLLDALAPLEQLGLLKLRWVEGQTAQDLHQALLQREWHIFHFIGHGAFDTRRQEGVLALANEHGKTHLLSATDLARLLTQRPSLRLVVLNSCQGAAGSRRDLFSSTAATLASRRIPAVLAMQYEISDQAAIDFTRGFYNSLAAGLPVDSAVTQARTAIRVGAPRTLEWVTPVLYLRSATGALFEVPPPATTVRRPVSIQPSRPGAGSPQGGEFSPASGVAPALSAYPAFPGSQAGSVPFGSASAYAPGGPALPTQGMPSPTPYAPLPATSVGQVLPAPAPGYGGHSPSSLAPTYTAPQVSYYNTPAPPPGAARSAVPVFPPPHVQATQQSRGKSGSKMVLFMVLAVILVVGGGAAFVLAKGNPGAQTKTTTPRATLVPTNTAISSSQPQPYTASIPGPGCDNGGAAWGFIGAGVTGACLAQGFKLSRAANSGNIAMAEFRWPNHPFPSDYAVSVDISALTVQGCAGVHLRWSGRAAYGFFICRSGAWDIYRYDSQGTPSTLLSGTVQASDSYHLEAAVSGTTEELVIDNGEVHTTQDGTNTVTESLALDVDTGNNGPAGSAVFRNFIYTPGSTAHITNVQIGRGDNQGHITTATTTFTLADTIDIDYIATAQDSSAVGLLRLLHSDGSLAATIGPLTFQQGTHNYCYTFVMKETGRFTAQLQYNGVTEETLQFTVK